MKISQIITLPVGRTGLSCEGTVVSCQPARNVAGISPPEKGGKPYNFWTQKLFIEDDTGKIGIEVGIEANRPIPEGSHIRIDKGVLDNYNGQLNLRKCKLAKPVAAGPSPAMKKEVEPVYDEKGGLIPMPNLQRPIPAYQPSETDKQKARGIALSYCLDTDKLNLAFKEDDEREGVYDLALQITQFILTGVNPYPKGEANE